MHTQTIRSNLAIESYSLRNMYLSVFVVKVLYVYIGMMMVWTSPLIPNLEASLQLSTFDKVAILASLPLGMALGPITGTILIPRYGFKSIFLEFGCLGLVSVFFLALRRVFTICVARLVAGVAIGAVLCYVEAYIQDISDQEVRTLMNPLNLTFLTIGFYLVYDLGQILLYFEMLLILLLVPAVFLVCLMWLPESPHVHVAAGSMEKAKKSVDFLHRGISTRGLDHLMLLIQEDVSKRESESKDRTNIPSYRMAPQAANVSLVFFTLLPLSGFPVMFMLLETLVGEAQQQLAVSSSLSAIAKVDLCPIPLAWVLNCYCNHKMRVIGSSAIMSLSMAAFAAYIWNLERGQDMSDVFWVPLMCTVSYTAAFLVGFIHKPDDGSSDPRMRDCGRVLTMTAGFFSMLLVTFLFFPIKAVLGTAPILCGFSTFSILLTIFVTIYTPEATLF